jgi:hypothetical protein
MKLVIGFSTKDQLALTEQSWERLVHSLPKYDPIIQVLWADASKTAKAVEYWDEQASALDIAECVTGGADAAIAWKLTKALQVRDATHIMLLENDVLLDEDWFEPTMALFEKGRAYGLAVGAVSARSYVDRVLIQRNGYAVMHNIGAGMVVFTREAAETILRSFRTHWWPTNRLLFAQLSGIDLATYACFGGRDQWVTTDWGWEAQLASHGFASLALTPAKCQMIGQVPPLEQQGLEMTGSGSDLMHVARDDVAFEMYRCKLAAVRRGGFKTDLPGTIHRDGAGMLFFPHQLGYLAGGPSWQGTLELQWSQGFGPFAYRAGPGGASLGLHISGSSQLLVTGGVAGARVAVRDTRSGFNFAPELPPATDIISLNVPGGPVPRKITLELGEGAVFYGLQTADPQMLDTTFRFNWRQLPEAK